MSHLIKMWKVAAVSWKIYVVFLLLTDKKFEKDFSLQSGWAILKDTSMAIIRKWVGAGEIVNIFISFTFMMSMYAVM